MAFVVVVLLAILSTISFVFLLLVLYKTKHRTDIYHRLRRYYSVDTKKLQKSEDILHRVYKRIQKTSKPFADLDVTKKLDFKIKQAGFEIFGAEFIIIIALVSLVVLVVTYIITLNLTYAPLAGVAVPILSILWLNSRIKKRRQAFTEQLGDCLTTVANALRAGYSFQQAMDVVAREMEPPISSEFEHVATDVAMGVTLENALEQMNNRVGSSDFDLVVTAVLIQREIGGNLAQILDTISYTINERIRMKREINALTAQGRFSALVLLVLPFVVAAFCWIFNHDQMLLFVNEDAGRMAIVGMFLLEFIGYLTIQRIVNIDL